MLSAIFRSSFDNNSCNLNNKNNILPKERVNESKIDLCDPCSKDYILQLKSSITSPCSSDNSYGKGYPIPLPALQVECTRDSQPDTHQKSKIANSHPIVYRYFNLPSGITSTDSFQHHYRGGVQPLALPHDIIEQTTESTDYAQYLDQAVDLGWTSTVRFSVGNAVTYTLGKIGAGNLPVKIVGAFTGAAAGSVAGGNSVSLNTNKTVEQEFPCSDYVAKYAASGIITGVTISLATPFVTATRFPANIAGRLTGAGLAIATPALVANAISAVVGMGVGTAINKVAVNRGVIPNPPTSGENGWIIEGAGAAFSTTLQYLVYTSMQAMTTRFLARNGAGA